MNFRAITALDAGDPVNRPWAGFTHCNSWPVDYCHLKAVLDMCKEPKGCRMRPSVAHRKRRGALTGLNTPLPACSHGSIVQRSRDFHKFAQGSDKRYHPIGSRLTGTRHARPTSKCLVGVKSVLLG